jgi:hypothetical protein
MRLLVLIVAASFGVTLLMRDTPAAQLLEGSPTTRPTTRKIDMKISGKDGALVEALRNYQVDAGLADREWQRSVVAANIVLKNRLKDLLRQAEEGTVVLESSEEGIKEMINSLDRAIDAKQRVTMGPARPTSQPVRIRPDAL